VKQRNNTTLEPNQVTWLRTFADSKGGISQAANFLGLSRNALTRAVAAGSRAGESRRKGRVERDVGR
jgi:DNA-binding phage protein